MPAPARPMASTTMRPGTAGSMRSTANPSPGTSASTTRALAVAPTCTTWPLPPPPSAVALSAPGSTLSVVERAAADRVRQQRQRGPQVGGRVQDRGSSPRSVGAGARSPEMPNAVLASSTASSITWVFRYQAEPSTISTTHECRDQPRRPRP